MRKLEQWFDYLTSEKGAFYYFLVLTVILILLPF
jgi:hypothetical protein